MKKIKINKLARKAILVEKGQNKCAINQEDEFFVFLWLFCLQITMMFIKQQH